MVSIEKVALFLFLFLFLPSTLIRQENGALFLFLFLFLPFTLIRQENGALFLFLFLFLPFTLIRQENGAFRKRSSNWRSLRTPALRFHVDGKHFENGDFWKRWRHDNHAIFVTEFSSNRKIQNDGWLLGFYKCKLDAKIFVAFSEWDLLIILFQSQNELRFREQFYKGNMCLNSVSARKQERNLVGKEINVNLSWSTSSGQRAVEECCSRPESIIHIPIILWHKSPTSDRQRFSTIILIDFKSLQSSISTWKFSN